MLLTHDRNLNGVGNIMMNEQTTDIVEVCRFNDKLIRVKILYDKRCFEHYKCICTTRENSI